MIASLLDERWDDVLENAVRAAAVAVDVPIALVTLASERLLLIAAHVGLPPELEVSRAVAREISFTRLVVATGQPLEVADAAAHPDVRPELTDGFSLRAYLGVPVRVGGVVVGDLCAIDTRARAFAPHAAERLARLVPAVEKRLVERQERQKKQKAPPPSLQSVELMPYLRLLQAVQVGALPAEAMGKALRVLPPVPAVPAGLSG